MGETLASIMNSRRAMTAELRNVNDYLQVALNNMARGVSMFDESQRLILCNRTYGEIYGIPDSLTKPGTPLSAIIRWYMRCESGKDGVIDVSGHLTWIRNEVAMLAEGKVRTRTQDLFNGRTVRITTQPLSSGGWVDVQEDITEQSKQESRLSELARRDALTGLFNRVKFSAAVEEAVRAKAGIDVAIHVIDVGCFQMVKERFGLIVRDALIQELGKALVRSVPSSDLVARLDGDVFGVLRAEPMGREAACDAERRLEAALSVPCEVFGHTIEPWVRVATVFAPRDGRDANHIVGNAVQQRLKALDCENAVNGEKVVDGEAHEARVH